MNLYKCPACGEANEETISYCKNCGYWLGNANKIKKKKGNKAGTALWIVLIAAALIGIGSHISPSTFTNKVSFETMEFDGYTISQFEIQNINSGSPSAMADVTIDENMQNPVRITAVFYNSENNRVGLAEAEINHQMQAGDTTTVQFKFESGSDLNGVANVRIEIVPITMLDTLGELMRMK